MSAYGKKRSYQVLTINQKWKTEEDVKHAYAEFFGIKYNTADKRDLCIFKNFLTLFARLAFTFSHFKSRILK